MSIAYFDALTHWESGVLNQKSRGPKMAQSETNKGSGVHSANRSSRSGKSRRGFPLIRIALYNVVGLTVHSSSANQKESLSRLHQWLLVPSARSYLTIFRIVVSNVHVSLSVRRWKTLISLPDTRLLSHTQFPSLSKCLPRSAQRSHHLSGNFPKANTISRKTSSVRPCGHSHKFALERTTMNNAVPMQMLYALSDLR